MRRFMLMGTLVAVVVAALAFPALAHERFYGDGFPRFYDGDDQEERLADFYKWFYGDYYDHEDDWWKDHGDRDDRDEVIGAAPAVEQSFEQQAESGDVNQSFNVSNTGDNSNQCAGIQGVANTGNAQNQISIVQNGSEAEDFDFEDVGSTITVSPSNTTSCDQQVNQAAAAYGW